MKEKPILFSGEMVRAILKGRKSQTRRVVKGTAFEWLQPGMFSPKFVADPGNFLSPYGYAGDRLWVRETWQKHNGYVYAADFTNEEIKNSIIKWKPSIFMPREASRITLEVVSVRVERVQDISEADVVKEGIGAWTLARGVLADNQPDPRHAYICLWDKLNAKRGYGWNINPWVWVVEFAPLASPHFLESENRGKIR